ncbi:hypothetical protein [Streptomyces sp. TBY4]|uniref:hypothetical protein n=1 Tax=Streptomyces sp. TBY4 TaxID=2962030 RepID=UPI0020B64E19|nr:hypothetical protein [Streptomyces sp. TBY4]MCP3758865.1 hypothetical protein [Streptomyces sp. TBY4]
MSVSRTSMSLAAAVLVSVIGLGSASVLSSSAIGSLAGAGWDTAPNGAGWDSAPVTLAGAGWDSAPVTATGAGWDSAPIDPSTNGAGWD